MLRSIKLYNHLIKSKRILISFLIHTPKKLAYYRLGQPVVRLVLLLFLSGISLNSNAQCSDGSQPECTCLSTPIYCSVDDLDGYSSSLFDYQHPGDGVNPCQGGAPHNPNWLAFIAWCENIYLTIYLTNCDTVMGSTGAQVGVYSDCSGSEEIDCVNGCDGPLTHSLSLRDLDIGELYYFQIDGCFGSTCDYTISVDSDGCEDEIEDWTNPISGDTEVCIDDITLYEVDDLVGAANYYWTVDGGLVATTSTNMLYYEWDAFGTFQLCVDVANACTGIPDNPMQICEMITVNNPDAGILEASPIELCPGNSSTVSNTDYNMDPGYEQVLLIVNPNGEVVEVITDPVTEYVTYNECGTVTVFALNFPNWENVVIPAVGDNYDGSNCEDFCCNEVLTNIIFEDNINPEFTSLPSDMTFDCIDQVPQIVDLAVTDNCASGMMVSGDEDNDADLCDGGIITREWIFEDDCGNEVTHTQSIMIDPIVPAEFINPPGDILIDCDGNIPSPGFLDYSNNDDGSCRIEGFVLPIVTGTANACGSVITYEWDYTDDCDNNINYVQTIEIMPADEASFINPPADTTLTFEQYTSFTFTNLDYNNGSANCEISGTVMPVINSDLCGGIIEAYYEYTDDCGRTIEYTQTVTLDPLPDAFAIQDTFALFCDENGQDRITINTVEELEAIIFDGQLNLDAQFYRSESDRASNLEIITFPFTMDSIGHQLLYVRVNNGTNCNSDVTIDIIVNNPPEIVFDIIDESCIGSNDGMINISINSGISPVSVLLNEDTLSSLMLADLAPNIYSFIAIDSIGCRDTFMAEVRPGLDIEFTSFTSTCNDNGTSLDETDDYYEISFTVGNNNGNSQTFTWSEINSGQNNSVGYGEMVNLQLNADGSIPTLNIVDDLLNCTLDTSLNALISCSTECIINVDNSSFDCDDNGTPLDPSDDFYLVSINASAINGGSNGTYEVFIDNVLSYSFNYGALSDFTVPANNQVIDIRIADSQLTSCFTDYSSPSLVPCSGDCEVNVNVTNVICNDNGTSNDADDDIFSFEIEVEIINGESTFYIPEVDFTGNTGEVYSFENYLILDGAINWTIQSNGSQTCETIINVTPPVNCSDPCTIDLVYLNIGDCEDNGTGNNSDDDFYFIEIEIQNINGAGSYYSLQDLNSTTAPEQWLYNQVNSIGPFQADGSVLSFNIVDSDNSNCFLTFDITQNACSNCTEVINLTVSSDILTCQNSNITTSLDVSGNPESYEWTGPQGFASSNEEIDINTPGWYFINVIFDNGCNAMDSVLIDAELDVPISNAGNDLVLNCENTIVTLSGVGSTLTNNSEISWFDENDQFISNEIEIEVSDPGTYTLSIIDATSMCPASTDQVNVIAFFNEPSAVIFADPGNIIDCVVESVDLYTPNEPNVIYQWNVNNNASDGTSINISTPSEVELLAIDTISLCANLSSLEVEDFTDYPIIDFAPIDDIDCSFNNVCVQITTQTLSNDIQYQWFDSNGNLISNTEAIFCINESGSYSIEVVDLENGCSNSEAFNISGPVLAEVQIESSVTLQLNDSYTFEPVTNLTTSEISTWNWNTDAELSCYDCANPVLLSFEDGDIVTVTLISTTGCEATADINLRLQEERILDEYYIPNIFSPGERSNFTIFTSKEIKLIQEMYIIDRWGEVIFENKNFEPNNPGLGWNGSFGGEEAEQGVYVYLFVFEANGRTMKVSGDITLLR